MALPEISTERLNLRVISKADTDAYHLIWGDPEVIWWGASPDVENSRSSLATLVEKCDAMPPGMGWSWLVERSSGDIVGDVCLQPAPNPPGGFELGWHLARSAWGHGYATEGVAPLLEHAWSIGLEEVVATIVPMNQRSVALAERLGMVRREEVFFRGGLTHGIWVAKRP